jgi:Leucine carboxyl methyltransferase
MYLAARTLFYDEFVRRAFGAGIRQVVILAAGYDSRAWRLARGDARFFEVDLPATQAAKRARASSGGPIFVAADVTDGTLVERLVEAGYDRAASTAFTIEGLTMYLGFEGRDSRRGRLGRATIASGGERFRFRLSQSDAPAFMQQAGWEVRRSLDGSALRERFLANTPFANAPNEARSPPLAGRAAARQVRSAAPWRSPIPSP